MSQSPSSDLPPPSSPKADASNNESTAADNENTNASKDCQNAVEDQKQQPEQQSAPTRKRTRATAEQLAVLEDTFAVNVSPNSKLRKQLAERLQMSERSIQIWFQNRRAKVKHMQKRAQMQMQQASIRAQLYHYHQQQYGGYGGPLMPLRPQQPSPYYRPYPSPHHHHHPNDSQHMSLSRSHSVDAVVLDTQQHVSPYTSSSVPHPYAAASVPPSSGQHHSPSPFESQPHQQFSYHPWQPTDSNPASIPQPDNFTTSSTSSTTPNPHFQASNLFANCAEMPTLVSVPDAGPTAMLANSDITTTSPTTADVWCTADALERAHSVGIDPTTADLVAPSRALSDPIVTTIDPSSLMLTPPASTSSSTTTTSSSNSSQQGEEDDQQQQQQQPSNPSLSSSTQYFNATTLTIGTWHRLKLRSNDLLCAYEPERHMFAWYIADNGCRFKMEVSLDAVASIEYMAGDCDVLADVHFDISEPPLFYMEQKDEWVQCSDFTEGKQASRFFRHTLKGVAHYLKQELAALTSKHEQTRRLVKFIETPAVPPPPPPQAPQVAPTTMMAQDPMYCWPPPPVPHVATAPAFMTEACAYFA